MSTSSQLCSLAEGVICKVQEVESSVSLLKSFKEQFNHRKNISKSKKRNLMWIDLESCFENRIRTGAIVNLSVKDPVEFFTRARRSFICKVKKELQRSLLKLEEFQERDSGWSLYEIIQLKINFNSYTPINVGISTYIEMPKFIQKTKAVLNIQNKDQNCFYGVLLRLLTLVLEFKQNILLSTF
nr:unnamed protein product [Callosobruchus chinensis]